MRKFQPGALFKANGRRFVDSQALYNFTAAAHSVEHIPDGYRVTSAAGSCRCNRVEGRPELPQQRGALYEITPEAGASMKALRTAWVDAGLVQVHDAAEAWKPAAAACGSCGSACACGPCQEKHGHHHGEDHA